MFLKKFKTVIYFVYWCWLFQWIFLGTDLLKSFDFSHDAYLKTGWRSTTTFHIDDEIWFTASGFVMFTLGITMDFLIIFAL